MTQTETRADKERRERRLKPGSLQRTGKLTLNEGVLDRDEYEYRWVNDRGGRVKELESQDWDVVRSEDVKDEKGVPPSPDIHGGVDDQGRPYRMKLMRKYKDWYQADQQEKLRPQRETMEQIRTGEPISNDADFKKHHYVPTSGIDVQHEAGHKKQKP